MENQYCKVGSTKTMDSGSVGTTLLESYYKTFSTMASDTRYAGTQMGEFFENKAIKFKKSLEELVS